MTEKHLISSLQQTAVLGTSHIIRKVLKSETSSLSGGLHEWFKGRSTRGKENAIRGDDDDDMSVVSSSVEQGFP